MNLCLLLLLLPLTSPRLLQSQPSQSFLNQSLSYLSSAINFLKRLLVLSALLFLIQNLINFWVLASSFHLLTVNMPDFFRTTLQTLYTDYNVSFLQYLNFDIPFPPTPTYGTLTCGLNLDFNALSFAFQPLLLTLLMLVQLTLFAAVMVRVKKAFRTHKHTLLVKILLKMSQSNAVHVLPHRHWSQNIHINRLQNTASIFINYMSGLLIPAYGLLFQSKVINMQSKANLLAYYVLLSLVLLFPLAYACSIRTLKHSHVQTLFQYLINLLFSLALGYQCSPRLFLLASTLVLTAYLYHALHFRLPKQIITRLIFWLFNLLFVVMVATKELGFGDTAVTYVAIACHALLVLGGAVELGFFIFALASNGCKFIYMLYNLCNEGQTMQDNAQQSSQHGKNNIKHGENTQNIGQLENNSKQENQEHSEYQIELKRTIQVVKILQNR